MKIKAGKRFFHFSVIGAGLFILLTGCAKQGSPPGGPEDRTPPKILSASPVPGSVQVPLDSPITIEFSEAIDRETVAKAVFISPLPDPEPKIMIKSDAIVIVPRQNLEPDKTYVVTIGTDLKDAHRVNLEQSISLAFATGATIDSGSISGAVYKDGKGTPGVSMALFEDEPEKSGLPLDSLAPDYITQSGEGGLFSFTYLPHDTFYLAAFEDKNRNRRINLTREMIGVPFSTTIVSAENSAIDDIGVQLYMFDSSTIALRSVSINPDRLVKVRLSGKLDPGRADSLFASAVLRKENDSTAVIRIVDYTNLSAYPASDFILLTAPLEVNQSYLLSFDISDLFPHVPDSLKTLTYSMAVPEGNDQSAPTLLASSPSDKTVNFRPDSLFLFHFSEPIDSASVAGSVLLIDAEEESSFVALTVRDSFRFTGQAASGLRYGQSYRLIINAPAIKDLSGNRMSDSAKTITFSTVGLDTLGQLSGEVRFANPADASYPTVVSFKPAREGEASQMTIPSGQMQFITDLLPGYYTVFAYLDRNDNGKFDYGSIIPYRLAEPFTAPADTFRVRTRFESAGVILEF